VGAALKVTMCDPPEGWRYGFPKPVHEEYHTLGDDFDLKRWLVNEGYPQELTTWRWFRCRFWEKDLDDAS
jgi:hypothetical protein